MKIFKNNFFERRLKVLAAVLMTIALISFFQNCGPSFEAQQYEVSMSSLGDNVTPCEIPNGQGFINSLSQCEVTACSDGFFADKNANQCITNQTTCAVANGSGIKQWQTNAWSACQVQSCNPGFHLENNTCLSNVRNCSGTGIINTQTWTGNAWGVCTTSQCAAGSHAENNTCVSNNQTCSVSQGQGQKVWNGSSWNPCQAISCNPGYHLEDNSCENNQRPCSNAQGSGTQLWSNNQWGICQITMCPPESHLEGQTCVPDNGNRACSANGRIGSQGYADGVWSSCRTCNSDAYTSFRGTCYDNPSFTRVYASFLPGCWSDGLIECPVPLHNAYISVPSRHFIKPSDSVSFEITYAGAASVSLTANHILVSGPGSSGCTKTISGSGNISRTVTLSGCRGPGAVSISVMAGSSTSATGASLSSFGPSPDVIVASTTPNAVYSLKTDGTYPGAKGNEISYEMHYPSNFATLTKIPILVWIHGGSWTGGNAELDRPIAQLFAELGFLVFNINYTLAPILPGSSSSNLGVAPTPYTVGPNDVSAFINYLKTNVHIMNGDTSKISIAGSSAGAHLALHQATRPDNTTQFHCVLDVAGPTNLTPFNNNSVNYPISRTLVLNAFGDNSSALNSYSPVYNTGHLKANRVAIFHQLRDNLVPIGQALEWATSLKKIKPSVNLTLNYADEINPYPWVNPAPSQVTHVYGAAPLGLEAIKHYADTQCR